MSVKTSLYRHYDADDKLLYVGITRHLIKRQGEHERASEWADMIATITIERFDTEQEARTAEHAAIHYEKPFWNNHNKKPKGRKRKHNYTQEQIDQIKHIWESEEGPARYKLAAVQEVYPEFKKSEWYRLKERDFKPRPPIRKEQSSE